MATSISTIENARGVKTGRVRNDGAFLIASKRDQVNKSIANYLGSVRTDTPLSSAITAALTSAGKRFRGSLVLASGEAVNGDHELLMDAAVAIEMVQAQSLILDDLPCMDDSRVRRDRPALHIEFGEAIALLAAATLLSEAYALLTRRHDAFASHRCQALAAACGMNGIAQGQVEDLARQINNQEKTAPLIVGALKLGLLCGKPQTDFVVDRLESFGHQVGCAYQLRDDAMDEDTTRLSVQKNAEQLVDRALTTLSHAGLDTPSLRCLAHYAVQRTY